MPATPSDATLERSVKEFLADRFKELAIEDASPALYQQAAALRRTLGLLATLAWAFGILSLLAVLITSFAVADAWSAANRSAELFAYCAALTGFMTLVVVCLRAGTIFRYRTWLTKVRLFEIPDSEMFSLVFEPVLDGTFLVAVLSENGSGSSIAPVSRRPIAHYLGSSALKDRALPVVLLNGESTQQRRLRMLKAPASEVVILRETTRDSGATGATANIAGTILSSDQRTSDDPHDDLAGRPDTDAPAVTSGKAERAKKTSAKVEAHWLSGIEETEYRRRSYRVANRYDGPRQHQVQTMLDIAYAEFNRDPYLSVAEVRKTVCKGLEAVNLPIGVGKKNAHEWIERMLARSGDEHAYSFVRRVMTEPDYEFSVDKRSQPELEFPPN